MELTGVELCCNAVQYNPLCLVGVIVTEPLEKGSSIMPVLASEDISLSWGIDSDEYRCNLSVLFHLFFSQVTNILVT